LDFSIPPNFQVAPGFTDSMEAAFKTALAEIAVEFNFDELVASFAPEKNLLFDDYSDDPALAAAVLEVASDLKKELGVFS